jgi:hypothetical protein
LKTKIVEKRKVLNTVIAYKNNSQCRQVIWMIPCSFYYRLIFLIEQLVLVWAPVFTGALFLSVELTIVARRQIILHLN